VRHGLVADNGKVQTNILGKHNGRVQKLAVEPGSPYVFYSCGEDGLVQHFDLRSNSSSKVFCRASFTGINHQYSSSNRLKLNSIIIDPRDPNYFSLGGSDEYARVYDIRNLDGPVETFCPKHLIKTRDNINITGMSYSSTSELLNMGLGPYPVAASLEHLDSLDDPQMYLGHTNSLTAKGVSFFGPCSEYVMSGSDCGHIFIWNKKDGRIVRVIEGDGRVVNQVEPHPNIPVFASCGLEKNITLWAP
ncbi:hypothetical protein M8C21_021914, partial [Ambrosia artemisiifolia]